MKKTRMRTSLLRSVASLMAVILVISLGLIGPAAADVVQLPLAMRGLPMQCVEPGAEFTVSIEAEVNPSTEMVIGGVQETLPAGFSSFPPLRMGDFRTPI